MRLGRYETLVRLGRGGMAEVFAARLSGEAGFAKLVAIKRILPHLADEEAIARRFFDEARLAALVSSPHVVQTLDVGRGEDGEPFIVLELVLGVSLAQLLADPLPSLATRVELVVQAALGLADVHEARGPDGAPLEIVHRDVSPHNILVGSDGRARLADFGIARANLPREETRTGVVLGKWGYMSPEQVVSAPVDARSDVYAMGCVAWEAIAGRRMHSKREPLEEVTARIVRGELPSLASVAPGAPAELVEVVGRALSRSPTERFADGRELAEALRRAARELLPVPRDTLVDEVRRAAGPSLSELESALRDLDEGTGVTASLSFPGATVSALLGVEWNPEQPTVSLVPEPATAIDRRAVARPVSPRFWVMVALGSLALGVLGAAIGGAMVRAKEDAGPENPSAPAREEPETTSPIIETEVRTEAPRPSPAPEAAAPEPAAPDPRPAASPPRARPTRRDDPRSLAPSPERERTAPAAPRPGVLFGPDRFDREAR